MRRGRTLGFALVLLTLLAGLGSGTAAAGTSKLVEGTLYDTSCGGAACSPCPPPCGPVPAPQSKAAVVCAQQKMIVCPLNRSSKAEASPDFCIQGQPCGTVYPVFSGEGAVVNVRKRGSSTVLATLPVTEGHFKTRLAPGEYVFHPYLPEETCLRGVPVTVKITAKMTSPVPESIDLGDTCLHPDPAQ